MSKRKSAKTRETTPISGEPERMGQAVPESLRPLWERLHDGPPVTVVWLADCLGFAPSSPGKISGRPKQLTDDGLLHPIAVRSLSRHPCGAGYELVDGERRLRAKTPLGNRIRQYLLKHGPTKPAVLAVKLDAEPREIETELAARPNRFRRGPSGWEAA
jgi:hypothetical protein